VTVFLLIFAVAAGFYMAWNIGANDCANAMGTVVGSGSVSLRKAIILAAIFEFAGAFLVGSSVADTIKGNIVPVESFASIQLFSLGMLAALLAASLWLNVATAMGQPVSTTHAIIGAVVGFAVLANGPGCVRWSQMGGIAASWVISPVVGALLAYLAYACVRRFVLNSRHPVFMARRAVPVAAGLVIFIMTMSVVFRGLPKLRLDMSLPQALLTSAAVAFVAGGAIWLNVRANRRHVLLKHRYAVIESWFGRLQLVTACYMAFAHGANDVANAIGPLAGAIEGLHKGTLTAKAPIPPWLLALGGLGIVMGLATYGYKVIESIGKRITEITPTRGFSAELGTATTVLVCSKLGLPISTTFVIVGAVMGVGMARGFAALDLRVIRKIFASWLVTIPISAVLSAILFQLLRVIAGR